MTTIQWTDETWNPTTGCSRVSEGCRNCYIERTPPFRMAGRKLGDPVQFHPDRLDAPLHWKKPRRVFVNSMSDLFHEEVSVYFINDVLARVALVPHCTFQVLTKRPRRMLEYFTDAHGNGTPGREGVVKGAAMSVLGYYWEYDHRDVLSRPWPLPNLWLGVSVEDQKTADERIPILLQTPAAVRFLSVEPLLGRVDLHRGGFSLLNRLKSPSGKWHEKVDWVIVGGESGPNARHCDVNWIRSIVEQCKAANVPVFVKQLGSNCIDRNDADFEGDTSDSWPMGSRFEQEYSEQPYQGTYGQVRLHKKGGLPEEWPEDLRVREYPR